MYQSPGLPALTGIVYNWGGLDDDGERFGLAETGEGHHRMGIR